MKFLAWMISEIIIISPELLELEILRHQKWKVYPTSIWREKVRSRVCKKSKQEVDKSKSKNSGKIPIGSLWRHIEQGALIKYAPDS